MSFIKTKNVSANKGPRQANFLLKVESTHIDENGNHVVVGQTINGKPMTVYGKPIEGEKDGQSYVFGMCSPQADTLTTKDADGKVKNDTEEMELGEGGIIQIFRGEFRGAEKVELVENPDDQYKSSHFKIHFYNSEDFERKGRESKILFVNHLSASTFDDAVNLDDDMVVDAVTGATMENMEDVRNRAAVIALMPTDDNGQVVGDVKLVYPKRWKWDGNEKCDLNENEVREDLAKQLDEVKAEIKKENPVVTGFQNIVGESMYFNTSVSKRAKEEMSTVRQFILSEDANGDKEVAPVAFVREGLIKEKYSVVKNKKTLQVNEYNSINTIGFTGGGKNPYFDKKTKKLVIPTTFVEKLAADNGLELSDDFQSSIKVGITNCYNAEKEFFDKKKADKKDANPEATAEKASKLDDQMDDEDEQSNSPGM